MGNIKTKKCTICGEIYPERFVVEFDEENSVCCMCKECIDAASEDYEDYDKMNDDALILFEEREEDSNIILSVGFMREVQKRWDEKENRNKKIYEEYWELEEIGRQIGAEYFYRGFVNYTLAEYVKSRLSDWKSKQDIEEITVLAENTVRYLIEEEMEEIED